MEIGPKDVEGKKAMTVFRYNGEKQSVEWENIGETVHQFLIQIQKGMFDKAKANFDSKLKHESTWEGFMTELNKNNVILVPWCSSTDCEEKIKERSGIESKAMANEGEALLTGQAKTLCIPLDHEPLKAGDKCFHCGEEAKMRIIWGRSY